MSPHEDTSSPHENTTSPQDPSREKSATGWGFFWILGEIVIFALALLVAIRFFASTERPDMVAWVLLVIAVVVAVDIIRRIFRARQINSQAARAAKMHERTQDPSSGEVTGR